MYIHIQSKGWSFDASAPSLVPLHSSHHCPPSPAALLASAAGSLLLPLGRWPWHGQYLPFLKFHIVYIHKGYMYTYIYIYIPRDPAIPRDPQETIKDPSDAL